MLWFWRPIALVATVVAAYAVAEVAYALVGFVSALPQGALWDDGWRTPLHFILLVTAIGVFISPAMRRESDAAFRRASVLAGFFLAAYAMLKTSHLGDPDIPLAWVLEHAVRPMQHWVGLG